MKKRAKVLNKDQRTIRIILALVVAGWGSALGLMGLAAMFWDRQ